MLSRAGLGSRRTIDRWLQSGHITVNGNQAKPGDLAAPTDIVMIRGKRADLLHLRNFKPRVVLYHKPAGEIVTRHDPEGRPLVFDRFKWMKGSEWISVGRLDINTLGLLLLTNDGNLANRLMHPSSEIEREYAVRVFGDVRKSALDNMKTGTRIDGKVARFNSIRTIGGNDKSNQWFHVILKEGRNREVRRLWESQGLKVSRLIRIRFGSVILGKDVRAGHWRELSPLELGEIYRDAGLGAPESINTGLSNRPKR